MKFTDRLSHAWNAFKGNEFKYTVPQNGYYNQYSTIAPTLTLNMRELMIMITMLRL